MGNKNIPQITQNFISMIKEKASKGTYRVNLGEVKIDVFPYVFPPQSPFSESTHSVYDQFGDLHDKKVLDIGTGTGIQAIYAALAGASTVDAVDIYAPAVKCAKHNARLNNLEDKINVWQSNLFNDIPADKYDLIIANLPILDAKEEDLRLHSLIDPNFAYHEELFNKSPNYLSEFGRIVLCHANLHKNSSFGRLEKVAAKNGFDANIVQSEKSLGHEWRSYEFKYTGEVKK